MNRLAVFNALQSEGPLSGVDLQSFTGFSRAYTMKMVKLLRDAKSIHITSFQRQETGTPGRCIPIYAVGNKPDAAPLQRLSRKENNRRYRKRYAAIIAARRNTKVKAELGPWAGLCS